MPIKLVELLGPQPILNLLPIRYLQPDEILFVGTPETHDTARHLQNLLKGQAKVHLTEVRRPHDPYDVHDLVIKKLRKLGWAREEVTFDISGGSKMEALGIAKLAREGNSLAVDVELVRGRYRLLRYFPKDGLLHFESEEALPELIDIGDYFHAHLPGFHVDGATKGQVSAGGRFEQTIYRALKPHVDEIMTGVRPAGVSDQIEIDLVVRRSNRVGIIEAKTGVKKAGIDDLDTHCNSQILPKRRRHPKHQTLINDNQRYDLFSGHYGTTKLTRSMSVAIDIKSMSLQGALFWLVYSFQNPAQSSNPSREKNI